MSWVNDLLTAYHVPYITEGHTHTTPGWVNIHCPFCGGGQNYHLGIHGVGGGCHCWRCGPHPLTDTLAKTLGLPPQQVRAIIRQYRGKGAPREARREGPQVGAFPLKFPTPNGPLTGLYRRYLERRRFDPDWLAKTWGVKQTGPVSRLDGISYSHRILIPIFWGGRAVSFQARDITGRSPMRYLACPKAREIIHHKDILYGKQAAWEAARVMIVVEGVTDAWRLGPLAAATFGVEFRLEQVLAMIKHADRFFIAFDNEGHAQEQAEKLAVKLHALGRVTTLCPPPGKDPGDMAQDDANHFVHQLIR